MNDTAKIIDKYIKKEGLNQNLLAKRAGIDRQFVNQVFERNTDIKFKMVERYMNSIGYSVEFIKVPWSIISKKCLEEDIYVKMISGNYIVDEGGGKYSVVIIEDTANGKAIVTENLSTKEECIEFIENRRK